MKRRLAFAVMAATAMAVAGSVTAAAPRKAPPAKAALARDWTRTVSETPEGGFRMGNPQAPIRIVEYGSFTCDHCAAFAAQGMPILVNDYVKTGKASLEYRTFVRDPLDLTAALVARCAPPPRFFDVTHSIYSTSDQWGGRVRALPQKDLAAANALPVSQRIARFAEISGFDTLALKAGVPAAKLTQCLSDKNGMLRLAAMNEAATKLGVAGTPSFLVNGKMTDAHNWLALQPLLSPPGG